MYTRARTHARTRARAHTHTRTHARARAHTHTHTHTRARAHTHTHTHTYIETHTHILLQDHNSPHVLSIYIIQRTMLQTTIWTPDIVFSLLFRYSTLNFNQTLHDFKNVEWFRYILIIFVFLFSPPWRWPHEWLKHAGDHFTIKLNPYSQAHLFVF
jgi:hypothetical protein